MLDITNKTTEEINLLTEKHKSVLELIKDKKMIPSIAIIFDIAINYIKEKYLDLNTDWKLLTMMCLTHQIIKNKINNETDITVQIDEFIKYYKENYDTYINDLGSSASEYDRDIEFVHNYYKIC